MSLTPEVLGDFTKATLDYFIKRYSWQDLSLDLQEYIMATRFMESSKVPVRGGEQLQHRVQVRNAGTYRHTGMYDTSGKVVVDHLENIQVPWAKQEVHYVLEDDEIAFQSRPETILELMKVRIHSMHNDWFEGMEEDLWTKPANETDKPRQPWGLPTWLVKTTAAGASEAFGFNGGNPTNFTNGVGGLSSTTYPNWANGTFKYINVNQEDLFAKWSEACHKCHFMAPHSYSESINGKPRYVFYTTYPVLEACHNQLFASNENLGYDIGKYRDQVLFKGSPVTWVPALTNSSSAAVDTATHPIYGVDWNNFKFYFKSGSDRRMLPLIRLEEQPTVTVQYMQTWCNFLCLNRRCMFVGHTSTFGQ